MHCDFVFFSEHAITKMAERDIQIEEVEAVIKKGTVIKHYPEDEPSKSWLILSFSAGQPIHVVVSRDYATGFCIVITAYVPDKSLWEPDFKTKKSDP